MRAALYICIVVLMPVMEFNPSWIEDIEMLCIVGPTASGKTRFAVWCAHEIERLKGVKAQIISADSRQVYKDMTLGTGKDLSEYGSVPYHLIDIAEAGEKYNLFQFKRDFQRAYSQIIAAGDFPILCGGSGLYVEAVLKDYDLKAVAPDASLRAELEKKSMEELVQMLTDLKAAKGTVPHNVTDFDTKKRVIRAIEIERAGFGNESEIKKALVKFFDEHKNSAIYISDFLKGIADGIERQGNPNQVSLFDDAESSKGN